MNTNDPNLEAAKRVAEIENRLYVELNRVISRYRNEYYLTYAQLVGVLQIMTVELADENSNNPLVIEGDGAQ